MSGRTVVVGAGLSGLTAAFALAQRGAEVVVLEAEARAGGAVRTERRGEFLLELGPNTVRPTPELRRLVEELGLSGEAVFTDPRLPRFVDFGGALHEVPMSPGAFVTSRLLSMTGKLRLLAEPLVRRGGSGEESLHDFVARRLGAEAVERLIEPFVGGIFAGSAVRLSAAATFPTLARWEREHGSLVAGAIADRRRRKAASASEAPAGLLSFRAGLEALPRALSSRLGPAFRPGGPATSVEFRANRWVVTGPGVDLEGDRVIVAAPAYRASALVSGFAAEAARALDAIPYPPLAVLHLAWPDSSLRRPLRGFGHLVAPCANRRILGAVWSSSLFPRRAPAGRALLTVFLGGSRDPQALELSDGDLVAAAARDLESEGLVRGAPEALLVTRWHRAIPQYERGHAGRIAVLAETERRWPGLRFVGNYRGGVSVGDVVREGLEAGSHE